MWTGSSGHCHAIDNEIWELKREGMRLIHEAWKTIKEAEKVMNKNSSVLVWLRKSVQQLHKTLLNFGKNINFVIGK